MGYRSIGFSTLLVPVLAILLASNAEGQATASAPATDSGAANAQENSQALPAAPQPAQPQPQPQPPENRILGVIPNFATTNLQNAPPLTPKQKFHLAIRSAIDPYQFFIVGFDAGLGQAQNSFRGYGQEAGGYGKRYGAGFADQFSGTLWSGAVYPTLLHEDPRYFRKGKGSFTSRLFYAISTSFWSKRDNGTWGFNYSNFLGNLTAGGISNIYYPSTDRGAGLTFQRAITVSVEGATGAIFSEFWPDVSSRVFNKKKRKKAGKTEAAPQ